MFTDGARKLQTDALARNAPRYLHLPTNRRYLVITDKGDSCDLQGVDMRTIPVSKETLADHNVWERLP
ncbi:hypothetical protein [Pseudomonas sp. zfem005]|uniref:hypothetical protein n=1 Tax=Pseudomonas sp. zfem005 TaxID=3078200 RepID=UPI0029282228|nr:hypothetical protein [Pseudomonas sp. zfem005]MDU9415530.1 hypothetical protein [Pseudomonas sp. zfem005]